MTGVLAALFRLIEQFIYHTEQVLASRTVIGIAGNTNTDRYARCRSAPDNASRFFAVLYFPAGVLRQWTALSIPASGRRMMNSSPP